MENQAASKPDLGPFQDLIGTWTNQNLHGTNMGGPESPYSYNIMPLPQEKSSDYPYGYILKNFKYHEMIKFHPNTDIATPAMAPNRGGQYTQNANALFYEQQVHFAEGPSKGQVVHVENGAWLHLVTGQQKIGPYGGPHGDKKEPPPAGGVPPQPPNMTIAKQISVPHGNSVLVLGSYKEMNGRADIGPYSGDPSPTPTTISTEPYKQESDGNPHPDLNPNPTKPLQDGAAVKTSARYIRWDVDTATVAGSVTNIPFEQRKARVTGYRATYWLQNFSEGGPYTQLAYVQVMNIEITIDGTAYEFPHITCNTLTKMEN